MPGLNQTAARRMAAVGWKKNTTGDEFITGWDEVYSGLTQQHDTQIASYS